MPDNHADDRSLWEFEVGLEVSTRYHDWRRATLDFWVRLIRCATVAGAVLALILAFTASVPEPVAAAAAAIAVVTLIDLIFRPDLRERVHTELYQRCQTLQGEVNLLHDEWRDHLQRWKAQVTTIRHDQGSMAGTSTSS